MGKLDGKTAIVTGASRGIGQAIAELFAAEGASVTCAARTLNEGDHNLEGSLGRTVAAIEDAGGRAKAIAVDISNESDCLTLVEGARDAFGPIDILVNNAALSYFMPIGGFATNHWVRSFAVNVHAPFILAKAVLGDMSGNDRGGAIVNIGSGAAIGPGRGPYDNPAPRGNTMYGATKAALERFTQGLAEEVAAQGNIAISCVSPSKVVPTPGTVYHHLVDGIDDPRGEAPEYMARAALLLASEPAAKVNGRVTYSQLILGEFGWIENPVGRGIDSTGSGYSQV
ncbi:MAG: SDR family NAD(P)-dependent oxidoreductase [Rhodospirillaceae bacterium]|nr:SDR family NAD(P)-dependent oxidoreductase [Rhodospirillaceae bacterium]MBT6977849.1 SDR family NAD(P)-dependent oxidoreductase [Rhodospirillaceae bacterium]